MSKEKSNSESTVAKLLLRLKSTGDSKAWTQFLDSYADTILHVASQYVYDSALRNECYLFICGKLSNNGFRRLLSYQPEGAASFSSWLKVVIANLCIDWQRRQHGRVRPFKSIMKLSRLDQKVFKYKFEQGLGFQTCLNSLQAEFSGLTEPELTGAVSRINEVLTSRQHWLLSTHQSDTVSLDDPVLAASAKQPADPGNSPETMTEISQNHAHLQAALARLSP